MESHRIVSREQWIAARTALLAKEEEFTRARDLLSQERRDLPWVRVDGEQVAESSGPSNTSPRETSPCLRSRARRSPQLFGSCDKEERRRLGEGDVLMVTRLDRLARFEAGLAQYPRHDWQGRVRLQVAGGCLGRHHDSARPAHADGPWGACRVRV